MLSLADLLSSYQMVLYVHCFVAVTLNSDKLRLIFVCS